MWCTFIVNILVIFQILNCAIVGVGNGGIFRAFTRRIFLLIGFDVDCETIFGQSSSSSSWGGGFLERGSFLYIIRVFYVYVAYALRGGSLLDEGVKFILEGVLKRLVYF